MLKHFCFLKDAKAICIYEGERESKTLLGLIARAICIYDERTPRNTLSQRAQTSLPLAVAP